MGRPKHRRCDVCNAVTARYVRTERLGPFALKVWATDPVYGEALAVNGTVVRCRAHAVVPMASGE